MKGHIVMLSTLVLLLASSMASREPSGNLDNGKGRLNKRITASPLLQRLSPANVHRRSRGPQRLQLGERGLVDGLLSSLITGDAGEATSLDPDAQLATTDTLLTKTIGSSENSTLLAGTTTVVAQSTAPAATMPTSAVTIPQEAPDSIVTTGLLTDANPASQDEQQTRVAANLTATVTAASGASLPLATLSTLISSNATATATLNSTSSNNSETTGSTATIRSTAQPKRISTSVVVVQVEPTQDAARASDLQGSAPSMATVPGALLFTSLISLLF